MRQDKLLNIFNKHAAKTVSAGQLQKLILEELDFALSSKETEEMADAFRANAKPYSALKGLYISERGIFVNIGEAAADMARLLNTDSLPTVIARKVHEALADALEASEDYSQDIKSGILKVKPFKPEQFKF